MHAAPILVTPRTNRRRVGTTAIDISLRNSDFERSGAAPTTSHNQVHYRSRAPGRHTEHHFFNPKKGQATSWLSRVADDETRSVTPREEGEISLLMTNSLNT